MSSMGWDALFANPHAMVPCLCVMILTRNGEDRYHHLLYSIGIFQFGTRVIICLWICLSVFPGLLDMIPWSFSLVGVSPICVLRFWFVGFVLVVLLVSGRMHVCALPSLQPHSKNPTRIEIFPEAA